MTRHLKVAIAGSGLAALTTAACLHALGVKDIAIYAGDLDGTHYIAAINFVLPDNPYSDTTEQYALDMLAAGYNIGNKKLVHSNYESDVPGLYAIGEACGGIHGACRCAGNAASLATLSGLLCTEALCGRVNFAVKYARDDSVRAKYLD
ncbi:MAG: FAD-binding protein [Synergistaceae bacterium]|nr:FAD-binding protein [Synergistaceae bacterium]